MCISSIWPQTKFLTPLHFLQNLGGRAVYLGNQFWRENLYFKLKFALLNLSEQIVCISAINTQKWYLEYDKTLWKDKSTLNMLNLPKFEVKPILAISLEYISYDCFASWNWYRTNGTFRSFSLQFLTVEDCCNLSLQMLQPAAECPERAPFAWKIFPTISRIKWRHHRLLRLILRLLGVTRIHYVVNFCGKLQMKKKQTYYFIS